MSLTPSLFVSATIPFFQTVPWTDLERRLDGILSDSIHYPGTHIRWREDMVVDVTGYRVPAAAERLVRWDKHPPHVIFERGFEPEVTPPNQQGIRESNADIGFYANWGLDSIFVSTGRYFRGRNNETTRWAPSDRAHQFEYEVFTYGGIDVGRTLNITRWHRRAHEIAFPGGIRREFIRSAREYNSTGHPVAVWTNPYFDLRANGREVRFYQLPDLVCNDSIDTHYWLGPLEAKPGKALKSTLKRGDHSDAIHHTFMGGDPDDLALGIRNRCPTINSYVTYADPLSRKCRLPYATRASFLDPQNPHLAYFFADTQFTQIAVGPHTTTDRIVIEPQLVSRGWTALRDAGFGRIDAVLPTDMASGFYFFARNMYALIDVSGGPGGGRIIDGPKKIAAGWQFVSLLGCKTIDAVLPYPGKRNEAYFFCGTNYMLVKYKTGLPRPMILQMPRNIQEGWPSLNSIGFDRIDSVLPNPANNRQAYFFYDTRYALIEVNPDSKDVVVDGPKWVADEWSSLKSALFYGEDLYEWTAPPDSSIEYTTR